VILVCAHPTRTAMANSTEEAHARRFIANL
jgi:hypothetical protein